jgi:threonine synthase
MSFYLICPYCQSRFDGVENVPKYCSCGKRGMSYQFEYDLDDVQRQLRRRDLSSFLSFKPLLPIQTDIPPEFEYGTTFTPLKKAQTLGPLIKSPKLFLKDESRNPSGSFKWRQAFLSLIEVLRRRKQVISVASTGNMALSFSKAATPFGVTCLSFIPSFTPSEKITLIKAYGGTPIKIDGSIDKARLFIEEIETELGWIAANTSLRPFLLESCKTTGYEICQQFGWSLPDKIFVPVGSGLHLAGIAKGIREFIDLGFVDNQVVQLFAVQSAECASYLNKKPPTRKGVPKEILAGGLFVQEPPEKELFQQIIVDSGGKVIEVSKKEILEAMSLLARKEGIFVEPSGAASLAGIIQCARKDLLDPDEKIVCILTGTGYHDFSTANKLFRGAVTIEASLKDFREKVLNKLTTSASGQNQRFI